MITDVIIPALNEERSISKVIADIPKDLARKVYVVDNGSSDNTGREAGKMGALVLNEPEKGYGAACLKAINEILNTPGPPDIILFLDADYSDHPDEAPKVIDPIKNNAADLCIGSRALGKSEKGSMTVPQIFGNWLATRLMKLLYGGNFTDLGPFRAIKWQSLLELEMEDRNFGWTIEMQIKALKKKMKIAEVPVSYRKRIGRSKVSGTVKGTILAGYKILLTIFKYAV